MLNLELSEIERSGTVALVSGVSALEGAAMVTTVVDGVDKARPSTGVADESFAGFAISNVSEAPTLPNVEDLLIPASGVVTMANLPVPSTVRVAGYALGDPAAAATNYAISGDVVTFAASEAGKTVAVTSTYAPALGQVRRLQGDIAPGNVPTEIGVTGIIKSGVVYTSSFDTTVDWAAAATVNLAADGKLTSGGAGSAIPCRIVHTPSVSNPFLGLSL